VSFARTAHDWEMDAFASFFRVFYLVRMRQEDDDKLWWISFKRVLFGVKYFYNAMGSKLVMMVFVFIGRVFGGLRSR
jgi:hypothetical protein